MKDLNELIKAYKRYTQLCSHTIEFAELYHGYDQVYIQNSHKELRKELAKAFKDVDFCEFSKEVLIQEFHFGPWDENLILCPLWVHDLIKDGTEVWTISDRMLISGKDNLDRDSRFGCFAWGFRIDQLRDSKLKSILDDDTE